MNPRHGTSLRRGGLSKSAAIHTYRGSHRHRGVLRAGNQDERRRVNLEARAAAIVEMAEEDRDAVAQMDRDDNMTYIIEDDGYSAAFQTIPPGDEGYGLSHEGGEHEVFEGFAEDLSKWTGIRRKDMRSRRDRLKISVEQWNDQMESLVDAYLEYNAQDCNESMDRDHNMAPETESSQTFQIEVVDLFSRKIQHFLPRDSEKYANVTLVRFGCIGASPLHPTVAITLRTLAVYRNTHRVCPRLSIQAEVRKLCHMHKVPFRQYLCRQFSMAYDVYLEILHRVDRRLKTAMRRDTPNWRMLNTCPACFYKLKDEPALKFSLLCEMDGNNSLKRTDASLRSGEERMDLRTARSDYWLSPEEVDVFKDEVKSRGKKKPEQDDSVDDYGHLLDSDPVVVCLKRWRNAGPDERKRMFTMFVESGLFLVACRHGFVLLMCDMIRSGELAKYPLAVVNKLLEVYGPNISCGYDIGCAFSITLRNSSLGARAQELNFTSVTGAFHGHSHNRGCQVDYHPLYVEGMGRADAEGCERVFSASNAVAAGTRHSSKFHRHQAIEEHFAFWDEDKYAALSAFLYNHYREALDVIRTCLAELDQFQKKLGITPDDFKIYFERERQYLRNLKQEPPEETLRYDYVEALEDLVRRRQEWNDARVTVNRLTYGPVQPGHQQASIQAGRLMCSALTKLQDAETHTTLLENRLLLQQRWKPGDDEYEQTKRAMADRAYAKALDELERLVVQRLFELTKLNMSGTGYKLRTQISKALQRRSEAIRNALARYNTHAASLSPPRPQLTWKEIVDYGFLGEFELLKNSRQDIREEVWTQPAHREATVKYFQLQRAREEIERLNVEVRRLWTAMRDEELEVGSVLREHSSSSPSLAAELRKRWALRSMVNSIHKARLNRIAALPGFSGDLSFGIREGMTTAGEAIPDDTPDNIVREVLLPDSEQLVIVDEEDIARELEGMTDFVLSIVD